MQVDLRITEPVSRYAALIWTSVVTSAIISLGSAYQVVLARCGGSGHAVGG